MHADVLSITRQDGIEVWTVNRPDAHNAIAPTVMAALSAAVSRAATDAFLRAVVLTGAGNDTFVSGADLKFLRDASPDARLQNDCGMTAALEGLANLPVPIIGALNGQVIGGGVEVALACDLLIAEPHSQVTVKHVAMGISPGWGGFRRLAARVGRGLAAKLLLTAAPVSADEALRAGLFDEVVAPRAALPRALELAQAAARTSPSALAATKALLGRAYACPITLAEEQTLFEVRAASLDHREALTAFFARRPPQYRPRGEG
jgi:enoyl-CoA hydratase/carnithine racemase